MIKEALPEGWKVVRLGDYIISKKGKKPKFVSREKNNEFSIPYVNIKAFEQNIIDEYTNGVGCVFCGDNDFLMVWDGSRSGYVGKAIKGAIGSTLVKLSFPNEVSESYAYYYLQSKYIEINTKAKGVGIPHVDPNLVWNYNLLLPPLPEQHLNVEKIEELFSELDKGIENLKTAQQQLNVYRQAVLKWAFEGKLTNEDVQDGELPEGWEWMKSGDLFSFVTSGSRGWAKFYSNDGAIFIRITNLEFNSLELDLRAEKLQYVQPPSTTEGVRTKVQEGDFLFSITGYLGMFAIAPYLENAYVNQHVCLCRPKDNFNKKYVGYWIISKTGGNHYLNLNTKGAVKAGLNLDDLKNFPVPFCAIKEQQQIVQEIESRLSVCDKMEETIITSLQQVEALRQSILKKAFEGKLVKAKVIPMYQPKNKYFYQMQVLGKIVATSEEKGIHYGEMTLAKSAYLIDKIYQIPTFYNYQRWHLGPYPPEIKKAINNKKFFNKSNYSIEVTDLETLGKYPHPFTDQLQDAVSDLSELFLSYPTKERSHQIELLATVCKVIEDIQSTDLPEIRKSMAEWIIDLPNMNFKNKAEKFNDEETKECVEMINEKGWIKKLITQ